MLLLYFHSHLLFLHFLALTPLFGFLHLQLFELFFEEIRLRSLEDAQALVFLRKELCLPSYLLLFLRKRHRLQVFFPSFEQSVLPSLLSAEQHAMLHGVNAFLDLCLNVCLFLVQRHEHPFFLAVLNCSGHLHHSLLVPRDFQHLFGGFSGALLLE